jgi:hypothetical protein
MFEFTRDFKFWILIRKKDWCTLVDDLGTALSDESEKLSD